MTNEIGKDILATGDITGLAFRKIGSKEMRQEIRDIRKQNNAHIGLWVVECGLCCVFWCIFLAATDKGLADVVLITAAATILAIWATLLLVYRSEGARIRVSALLSDDAAKVELELVKKLHTTPKYSTNPDDDELFYPVIYQDTGSGRSGIYYVREEEYAKEIGSRIEAIKYNSFFLRDGYAVKNN